MDEIAAGQDDGEGASIPGVLLGKLRRVLGQGHGELLLGLGYQQSLLSFGALGGTRSGCHAPARTEEGGRRVRPSE